MEIKKFKKQADLENYILSLEKNSHHKILETEKGFFHSIFKVLIFDEKDILEYVKENFIQIIDIFGIKDYQQQFKMYDLKIYIRFNDESKDVILLKKHGIIISSVQNLLSNYVFSKFSIWYQIEINVNNHLHQQKYFLKKMVYQAVKSIKTKNQPYHLKPMPNDQRRIIHEMVKQMGDYYSYSEDRGYARHVVITNKNSQ